MKEQEIIESLKKENSEFRKLSEEHKSLEGVLAAIDKNIYLSPEQEIERKKLQKEKLFKKDRMAAMIRDFKKETTEN